jgi:hypothetical protein
MAPTKKKSTKKRAKAKVTKKPTAKRWTKARRTIARENYDKGEDLAAAVAAVGLPKPMVVELFNKWDNEEPEEETKEEGTEEATEEVPEKEPKPPPKKDKKEKKPKGKKPKGPVLSKSQRISGLIDSINAHHKQQVVTRASEMNTSYLLRRPTGILSLDLGLAGGFPAASFNVIVGPDGCGKDYLLNRTIAEQQRIQGENSAVMIYSTEFKYDKLFARNMCGVQIAHTDDELEEMDEGRARHGHALLTDEEKAELQTQIGEILLVEGVIAERGLDTVLDGVASNEFQLIAINSLGVLQTAAKEEKDSLEEFPQQASEAMLMTKFFPKLFMQLNGMGENGLRQESTILATNQVRAKRNQRPTRGRPVQDKDLYQSGMGAWAMKHGKAIELMLHKGKYHYDLAVKPPEKLGLEVKWELTKGKLGTHDGIQGRYDFFFDGGADTIGDLFATAVSLGVLAQSGSHYTFPDGTRAHGKPGAHRLMIENPELATSLRESCLHEAEVVCRYQ